MNGTCCLPAPTVDEVALINKLIQVPRTMWTFNPGPDQNFSFKSEGYWYGLYVSGGTVYQLRVKKSANDLSFLLEMNPTDELRQYGNALMEDFRKKQADERSQFIKQVDFDLVKIINFV